MSPLLCVKVTRKRTSVTVFAAMSAATVGGVPSSTVMVTYGMTLLGRFSRAFAMFFAPSVYENHVPGAGGAAMMIVVPKAPALLSPQLEAPKNVIAGGLEGS